MGTASCKMYSSIPESLTTDGWGIDEELQHVSGSEMPFSNASTS